MESEAGITSFKAGDVSIEQESKTVEDFLDRAKDFYEKKAADIIPLCKDDSFAFNQIKVM